MHLNFALMVFGVALGSCGGTPAPSTESSAGSPAVTSGGASASAGASASGGSAGALASSGSAGGPASAGAGGALVPTNPPYYGTVQLGWLGAATFQTLADARFTNPTVPTGSPCTSRTVGACTVATCTAQEGTPAPQAGVIALSDGDKFNVSLMPRADGTYATYSSPGILLPGDQTITVTASGGNIPAFSATIDQPLVLLVTAPSGADGGTFSWARTQDLALTFQRGMPGVDLIVQGGSASTGSISCTFPSEAGSAIVPATALAALAAGDSLFVLTTTTKRVQAGSYSVDLFAFGTATKFDKERGHSRRAAVT